MPTPGTTPAGGTASGGGSFPAIVGSTGLPCGQVVINNNFYVVTTTTTTTTVDGPITAAAGSITTAPGPASPAAARPPASAVGRPLRARGGSRAGHKKNARARRVRARPSGRPGHAKRMVRIRLIRMGHATHR
jgi:hypothetical protein